MKAWSWLWILLDRGAVLKEQQRSTEYLEQRYKIESQGRLFMELNLAHYHTYLAEFVEVVSDNH